MQNSNNVNRQIVLASRPHGAPTAANFSLVWSEIPQPREFEVLIKHDWLGLAPAAKVRMNAGPSYAQPTAIGEVIFGQAVGTVVESRHPDFVPGDLAMAMAGGWQEFSLASGPLLSKVDANVAPPSVWLGALGTSGLTAYVGMLDIGQVQPGDTVVVSAASGAVGSTAGQIAKLSGARVVGIAGGHEKCRIAVEQFGFDECVDYRADGFDIRLRAATPSGINLYFENVGGQVQEAVWPLMAQNGRVVVCGLISEYNDSPRNGPDWASLLARRLTVRGFIVADHFGRRQAFQNDVSRWYADGSIKVKEHVSYGLEQTPEAFIGMLNGENYGKTLIRL